MSTPIRRTRSACCAPAARGHATVPPSPAMNCRRRIGYASEPLYVQPTAVRAAWERVENEDGRAAIW